MLLSHQVTEGTVQPKTPATHPIASLFDPFSFKCSNRIVTALSILAAIRILVFVAAFPLCNTDDERFHLLTIQMYAQGHLPGKELPRPDPEVARTLLLYLSPEYGLSQETMDRDGIVGPLYGLPAKVRDPILARDFYAKRLGRWLVRGNFEAQSAPLYYLISAAWYKVGEVLGMRDWVLDYWPRFLNPIAYALLVWLSYWFVRRVYPKRTFMHLAVPALIAVFPQDVFFGMNRDVFSAPLAAAALLWMMRAADCKLGRPSSLFVASLLVGLGFVLSVSNCVLFGALAATLCVWVRRSEEDFGRNIWVVSVSILLAGLLPSLWMLRNFLIMGDLTGGSAKIHSFGWTVKPVSDMLHHPLFSLEGSRYFLLELTRRFWRGEYVWHDTLMRSVVADRFYLLSTAVFLLVFVINFISRRKEISPLERLATFQAVFLVGGSILFLAAISLPFDYHGWSYPSRALPFFVSGRIISGALLPFVLMYASGFEVVVSLFRKRIPPVAVLAALLLFITVSEIRVRSVVFSSPYNLFALSSRHPDTTEPR